MNPLRPWQQELPKMLERQEPESLHLDYKGKDALLIGSSMNREKRATEISKDVSAFLNSDGGTIIYGVRETASRGPRLPLWEDDPEKDGFAPDEIAKEDVENLITSTIQYRPDPDLFCVTPVDFRGRLVFAVDLAKSFHGVFQAKDKKYYKRFNFKSEPMEHYEVEDVRKRATSPNLELMLGLTDAWETSVRKIVEYQTREETVAVHLGLVNRSPVVAETALVELGLHSDNLVERLPQPFVYARDREIWVDGVAGDIPWYRCRWTPQNLGQVYTPLFQAQDPEYLQSIDLRIPRCNYSKAPNGGTLLAVIYWRLQAPGMTPATGMHFLVQRSSRLRLEPDDRTLDVGSASTRNSGTIYF